MNKRFYKHNIVFHHHLKRELLGKYNSFQNHLGLTHFLNHFGINPILNHFGINPILNHFGINPIISTILLQSSYIQQKST